MKQLLLIIVMLITSITNAQIFDFSCGPTTEELIFERKETLSSIGESSNYVNNVSGPNAGNSDIYEVIISRTLADGTEQEYFHKGIDNSYLGNPDGAVEYGFDGFYAEALEAANNAENDGIADTTTARTLLLEGASSATTSVTIRWDGGHIITVDGNDILSRDHGHNNYGRSTQDQFDALLKVVEDAVIAADAAANLSLGDSRKQQLEDLSRDGVFVNVTNNKTNGYFITFLDSEDNHHIDGGGDPFSTGGAKALEDLTDFDTSLYINIKNQVTNIVDNFLPTSAGFTITESELNGHAITASTEDVLVTPEMGDTDGVPFVQVVFSDKSGHLDYTGTFKYSNGGKLPTEGTEEEFDIWVDSWTLAIADYQTYIDEAKAIAKRDDFISQLETAFIDEATSTVTITLIKDNNDNDAILFSEIGGSVSFDSKFNKLLENLEQPTITTAINALAGNVAFLQILINEAYAEETADLNDKISSFGQSDTMGNFIATVEEIDDAINHATNPGAAVKSLFTDLLGKTTSTGDIITTVLANSKGTTNGVTYRLINVFTDAGWFSVRGPAGVTEFDSMNGNQVKEFYLAVIEQAWYQTNLN